MTNTLTGDIPPPPFINSVDELRGFSAALSAFLCRYDELHNHISFINSAINSKLPNHVLCSVNPNQSAVTSFVGTSYGHTITAVLEDIVTELNPKAIATATTTCERRHAIARKPESPNFTKKIEESDTLMKSVEIDTSKKHLETDISKKLKEINVSKKALETDFSSKPEETDTSKKLLETDFSKKSEEIDVLNKPVEINVLKKHEEIEVSEKLEEIDVQINPEEIEVQINSEEIDESKKHEEIDESTNRNQSAVSSFIETSCGHNITDVLEDIVSEPNPKATATITCKWRHANARKPESPNFTTKKLEKIDILKKPEEIFVSKKPGEIKVLKIAEEIDESKEPGNFDLAKKPEEINVSIKAKKTNILKNPEEFNARKKPGRNLKKSTNQPKKLEKTIALSIAQYLCRTMCADALKTHIATHYPELNKRPKDIAKALKLATDPAKLVLNSIRRFFMKSRNSYNKVSSENKLIASRRALVLILKCFVMISSDGIKISKEDLDNAAEAAFDWRKRAIKEGGLRYMHEDDAKGLLFLISGFGIPDRVFNIEDIRDLIRVCNRKEICSALRRSSALVPRVPEVVDSMVKSNLEIEAADIAYTFGLEDKCQPATILTKFLHNKIQEFRNGSRFQANAAVRQHLSDLKSIRKCLEDHKVDPSKLFLDSKINEVIQLLKKVIDGLDSKSTGEKSTLKRKAKEFEFSNTANHQQAKQICYSYEDMPNEQSPVDRSTYFDCNPVARGLADGGPVAGPMVHTANHRPYGLNDQLLEIDASKKPEEIGGVSKKALEAEFSSKPEETDTSKKLLETNTSKKLLETDFSKKPEEIYVLKKLEDIEASEKVEKIEVLKKPEKIYVSKKPGEIKVLKYPEEIVESKEPENSDLEKKPEEIDVRKKAKKISILKKFDARKKLLETDFSKKPEEIKVLKKLEEIEVSEKLIEIDVSKKAKKTNILKNFEEFDARKKLLEIEISKKPEEIHQSKKLEKPEEIDQSKKLERTDISNKLQYICKTMCARALKKHIQTHLPHPNEIKEALKLAIDPARLVLQSIGKFYLQTRKSYTIASRRVLVLILEGFVMISSDGIKISKQDLDDAYEAAFEWRKRAIKEGGLRYMHEDDAKGLLLLICGFGILDRVFKIEDIRDLIRVCNRKEISSALRRSSVLMPRIPEVVNSMVKNNLEIEAADIAYTFGLEDKCHPETILTNFLRNKVKEFRNGSRSQSATLQNAAMRQHLSDLISIRKCLEDHNVDHSKLLHGYKINNEIQYLKKVINLDSKSTEEKSTLKRKEKEFQFSKTANYQQAKRVCYSYGDMPNGVLPVDQYGVSQFDWSTYFDHSAVALGLAGGGYGGLVAGPMVHTANHRPSGQPYLRQSQTYDSHPSMAGYYDRPPLGGGFGRRI